MRYTIAFCFLFLSKIFYGQSYDIKDFKVQIHLAQNGSVAVTEEIEVFFNEERRGIFRNIPYKYLINKEEVKTSISDIYVENHPFKVSKNNGEVTLKIGDKNVYLSGPQKYVIKYKINKPFFYHDDFTEFYFNIIGGGWNTDIQKASFVVSSEKAIQLDTTDFKGFEGITGSKIEINTLRFENGMLKGESNGILSPGASLTIAMKLPLEAVARPSELEKLWKAYGHIGVPSVIFLFFLGFFSKIFNKHGKEYPHVVAARFTPPIGISPAEAGVIIDERVDNIDVMVLIPHWAQQGYLKIKRLEKKWSKDDHELTKLKDLNPDAKPYEKLIFNNLFESGDVVNVSDLENEFYSTMSSAKILLKNDIDAQDIYYKASRNWQIGTGMASVLSIIIGFFLSTIFSSIVPAIIMVVAGIIGFIYTAFMLKKTRNGIRMYEEVIGFKEFVQRADKDRIERLLKDDPMYFEKTLAYAIVFGYAKQWGEKFDGLLTAPPQWYTSSNPMMYANFHPGTFGGDLTNGVREIQSSFNSMPASGSGGSSGGDFGGGGFSGGGFGGGGGGDW